MTPRFYYYLIINIFFLSVMGLPVEAQEIDMMQREKALNSIYGMEKLSLLNELTAYYQVENSKKAFRYARQATDLAGNIFQDSVSHSEADRQQQVQAFLQYGEVLYGRDRLMDARKHFEKAKAYSANIENQDFLNKSIHYIADIDQKIESGEYKQSFFRKTVGSLEVGKVINKTSSDLAINTDLRIARFHENNRSYKSAVYHYEKAINLLRNQGDQDQIRGLQLKIAVLLDSIGDYVESQKHLAKVIDEIDHVGDSTTAEVVLDSLGFIPPSEVAETAVEIETMHQEKDSLRNLSKKYYDEKDFQKSLEYFQLYEELSMKLKQDSIASAALNKQKEGEIMLLRQQKLIADLNVKAIEEEKANQVRIRKAAVAIVLLVLLVSLVVIYFYVTKRKEHKKLTVAYGQLNQAKTRLEQAELKIVTLLKQQVSGDIATELLRADSDKPAKRFVCVMFLDIRDFTPRAEKLSPEELIRFQNDTFGFMIDIVQQHHGNINQLLGDGFMATFGAPVSHGNDCQNAFHCSRKILEELDMRNAAHTTPVRIGIGLHAGNVVTGNVGNDERKQYSVTGNPVIIASRVEQLNKKFGTKMIITEDVCNNLDEAFASPQDFMEEKIKGRKESVKILTFT